MRVLIGGGDHPILVWVRGLFPLFFCAALAIGLSEVNLVSLFPVEVRKENKRSTYDPESSAVSSSPMT